jgi:hypothetical protein
MLVCSAIKFQYNNYPVIICGKRHGDCFKNVSEFVSIEKWKEIIKDQKVIQGFLTDENKFFDRKQAATYAYQCGQIDTWQDTLLSEDLW